MMKKRKIFWILIGLSLILMFLLFVVSNVIAVGERLQSISIYLEYGFYAISIFVVYFLFLNPLRIILFSPAFSIQTVLDEPNKKNHRLNKRLFKRIAKQKIISPEDIEKIKSVSNDDARLQEELSRVFNGSVKKELNKIIMRNAKTVMLSTAISQNSKLDVFSIVTVNLNMIKELVLKCGFRPSFTSLGKLSLNVFATALIADGLENMNIEDMLPTTSLNALNDIPFIKPVISSATQGIANALMTIRIGVVTRKYLFADAKALSKVEIRVQAIKESLAMIPLVVKDAVSFFPTKIGKLFSSNNKKTSEE